MKIPAVESVKKKAQVELPVLFYFSYSKYVSVFTMALHRRKLKPAMHKQLTPHRLQKVESSIFSFSPPFCLLLIKC